MSVELKKITNLRWRAFLGTDAGIEGMLFLREQVPTIIKGQPHEIQFDAGFTMGYLKCLDTISEIIANEVVKDSDVENK